MNPEGEKGKAAVRRNSSLSPTTMHPRRHCDRFSRLCGASARDQQTDTLTDHDTCVTMSRILCYVFPRFRTRYTQFNFMRTNGRRYFSGIQRAAQTVLGVYLKHTCSHVTTECSALGVFNDYALYKSTRSLTHSLPVPLYSVILSICSFFPRVK